MSLPIAVVGGGSFGQGLSLAAARVGRHVILWSRQARQLGHEKIRCTVDLADVAEAELVFMSVPSTHVADVAARLGRHLDGSHLMVHVSRGLVSEELQTVSEVLRTQTPCRRVGALAGPLVAQGLAEGQSGGGVIGSLFPEVAEAVSDAIGGPSLRIYSTDDVVGVEIASAAAGLVALSLGYAKGMGMGPGTLAVLATRGLFEAARVGVARGGRERTFAGLAGAGDLMAAVAGDGRPEIKFGRALADGLPLDQATTRAGAYIEAANIARQVAAFGERRRIPVPLASGLAKLMAGEASAQQVHEALMARPAIRE